MDANYWKFTDFEICQKFQILSLVLELPKFSIWSNSWIAVRQHKNGDCVREGSNQRVLWSKYFSRKITKPFIKFDQQKEEFNGRPDGFFYRMRTGNKRLGIVFNDGEIWHEQRLFSVKTLRQLGMNKDSMATHIKVHNLKI